jgi:hypothetical protein
MAPPRTKWKALPPRYVCACGIFFKQKCDYRNHAIRHMKGLMYICDDCFLECKIVSEIRRHVVSTHKRPLREKERSLSLSHLATPECIECNEDDGHDLLQRLDSLEADELMDTAFAASLKETT